MSETSAPADYVRLAFLIERYLPEYVDAYCGPPGFKSESMLGARPALATLEESAGSLLRSVASDPGLAPDRRIFLQDQILAMQTTIRILQGRPPDFLDEVQSLYGVRPAWVDEAVFEEAHRTLNDLLPGPEPLAGRVQAFRSRSRVPLEVALPVFRQLAAEFRQRTRHLFDLPAEDACEVAVVNDRPWMANNRYLGERKSRIELNGDFPIEMWEIPIIVAHEAYPGHHTEYAIKEAKLYLGQGRLEHSIFPANNPSSLISEGIAKNALLAVASEGDLRAILSDGYARAGLAASDAAVAPSFIEANRQLERVSDNQLLLLYRDRMSDGEVARYGMRYALTSPEDESRYLRFFKDPLSRSYAYNYTLGRELVAAYLDRAADRTQAFNQLLSTPVTPSQLIAPRGNASQQQQG